MSIRALGPDTTKPARETTAALPVPGSDDHSPADARRWAPSQIGASLRRALRETSLDSLLLAGTTVVLVVIGVVMVFSSSSVTSLVQDGNPFSAVVKQAGFAFIGLAAMLLISRVREETFMRFAWLALAVSCLLQLIVVATPLGVKVAGNTNWLNIGPVQLQPCELIKLALVIWLGLMVSRKERYLGDFRRGLLPILLGSGFSIGLVAVGGDLGTVVIMVAMVFGALILIGIPWRLFVVPGAAAVVIALAMAFGSKNRLDRVLAFVNGTSSSGSDYLSSGWQLQHGMFALANGGIFGVGIGNSTAKWSWLPAADNDFIFAIIGEELGLIGAIVVLALFAMLCYSLIRVFRHASTPFGRTATASVMVWVMFQATANIAVVLGIIPVLGVPLPLVSAGGTALVSTLFAIGVVLSVARQSAGSPASARERPSVEPLAR